MKGSPQLSRMDQYITSRPVTRLCASYLDCLNQTTIILSCGIWLRQRHTHTWTEKTSKWTGSCRTVSSALGVDQHFASQHLTCQRRQSLMNACSRKEIKLNLRRWKKYPNGLNTSKDLASAHWADGAFSDPNTAGKNIEKCCWVEQWAWKVQRKKKERTVLVCLQGAPSEITLRWMCFCETSGRIISELQVIKDDFCRVVMGNFHSFYWLQHVSHSQIGLSR